VDAPSEGRVTDRAPYSRVYWSVMDDAKFDGIREDVRHLGAWCLLLIVADMAHPAPAFVPASVPKASFRALTECGLIDVLSGGRFRVHGLESERAKRSETARNASASRWHTERNAKPMLDETRLDKTSNTRASAMNSGARRKLSTVDRDPELRAQREAQVAKYGHGMDEATVKATDAGWKVKT
jgi:hypothetical protein